VIGHRLHRRDDDLEVWWRVALPRERVNADFVSPFAAGFGDLHEVPLQSAEREVLEQDEGEFHVARRQLTPTTLDQAIGNRRRTSSPAGLPVLEPGFAGFPALVPTPRAADSALRRRLAWPR